MKSTSYRHDINRPRPRPRHGHKYTKYEIKLWLYVLSNT